MLCFLCFVLLESSGGYAKTPNAFIFSLNNYESVAPFVSKVKPEYTGAAIERRKDRGPKFGADLIIPLDMKSEASLGFYYSVPSSVNKDNILKGPEQKFEPDEVEVFYLDPSRQMQDNKNWVQLEAKWFM